MFRLKCDYFEKVVIFLSSLFVVMAILGGIRAYSPVPFWDMWNGYLEFYVKAMSGDFSIWWSQHNEHRIFLSRILFWVDLKGFSGAGWFLIFFNYILLSTLCFVFMKAFREKVTAEKNIVFFAFLVAWLFYWIDSENLTWGFQSQFILAQLLPLISFYLLHKYAQQRNLKYFAYSVIFGFFSIGAMANGVLALPLLTVMAFVLRLSRIQITFLIMCSISSTCLYFYGYVSPAGHGQVLKTFQHDPVGVLRFVMFYVGGPFYYILGKGSIGAFFAQVSGFFLMAASVRYAVISLKNGQEKSLDIAMLFFIGYVIGSAFATAGGRLVFGLEQAASSRYMTPALMAWAALFVLIVPTYLHRRRKLLVYVFLPLLILMLPIQLRTLSSHEDELFEKKVAALALELGVKDQNQINHIFPSADWALLIAKEPVQQNLSIFGMEPFKNLNRLIGQEKVNNLKKAPDCLGSLDQLDLNLEDSRYANMSGWVFDPIHRNSPPGFFVLDGRRVIVGYVLVGQGRVDVARSIDANAKRSGYRGYVLLSAIGNAAVMLASDGSCEIGFKLASPVSKSN